MWISTIRKDEVYHVALDSQGNKLDEFTMDNDAYQEWSFIDLILKYF